MRLLTVNECSGPIEAWHFLRSDRRPQYPPHDLVEIGQTVRVEGPLVLCSHGLHASRWAIDALKYAPGPVACRVVLSGEILDGADKFCATERTVLAMADASDTLFEFACKQVETALRAAEVEDRRCWESIGVRRRWLRGEATDRELAAARSDAWDAACAAACADPCVAACAAACGDPRVAACAAACVRSRADPRAAARDAAWDAARVAANRMLESMLAELMGFAIPEDREKGEGSRATADGQ